MAVAQEGLSGVGGPKRRQGRARQGRPPLWSVAQSSARAGRGGLTLASSPLQPRTPPGGWQPCSPRPASQPGDLLASLGAEPPPRGEELGQGATRRRRCGQRGRQGGRRSGQGRPEEGGGGGGGSENTVVGGCLWSEAQQTPGAPRRARTSKGGRAGDKRVKIVTLPVGAAPPSPAHLGGRVVRPRRD